MPFYQRLRGKLWPSNDVFLKRSDEMLAHLKTIEGTLGTMKHERNQLKSTVKTLDAQIKRLTSMQEYCSALVRTKSDGAILLAGWYGANNLGDELMMRTLVGQAPESVRKRLWVLTWQNASYDLEWLNEQGVRSVRYPRSTEETSLLADSFDTIIWGGGAILDDGQYNDLTNNINTGNLFIRLNEYLLSRGKQVFAIGLSTNWQFESAAYIERLNRIIQEAESFSVRDERSRDVLSQAGIDSSAIGICPDVVFGNHQLHELDHLSSDDLVIGFVPMYIKEMHDTNKLILEACISKLAHLPENTLGRITLIPFYRSGDARHFKWLKETCSHPELVDIEPYATDLSTSALSHCSAVICSRYHAALVAGIIGAPFLCVYPDMHAHYRNKCRYLSEIYNCPDSFIPATTVTADAIRTFVDGSFSRNTQPHQFYNEATHAIEDLWLQTQR